MQMRWAHGGANSAVATHLVVQALEAFVHPGGLTFVQQMASSVRADAFVGYALRQVAVPLALDVGGLVQIVQAVLGQAAEAGGFQRATW